MSDESFRYAAGESPDCVVPAKAPNKDPRGSAEGLEGRRVNQGEHRRVQPVPDTEPENRVRRARRCAGGCKKG